MLAFTAGSQVQAIKHQWETARAAAGTSGVDLQQHTANRLALQIESPGKTGMLFALVNLIPAARLRLSAGFVLPREKIRGPCYLVVFAGRHRFLYRCLGLCKPALQHRRF